MANFELIIDCANSAFCDSDGGAGEVARILRQTAERIEQGEDCGRLMDYNGNGCGSWNFEPTEPTAGRCGQCDHETDGDEVGETCDECGRGVIERAD